MRATGIREIKNHLSRFLRLVREGEVILITDRGEVIAQLAPAPVYLEPVDDEWSALEKLQRLGRVRLGRRGPLPSSREKFADVELDLPFGQAWNDVRADRF